MKNNFHLVFVFHDGTSRVLPGKDRLMGEGVEGWVVLEIEGKRSFFTRAGHAIEHCGDSIQESSLVYVERSYELYQEALDQAHRDKTRADNLLTSLIRVHQLDPEKKT